MRKLVIGLVIGLIVGFALGHYVPVGKKADPWIDAGLTWELLPSHTAAGALPQVFGIPARAYDYGASSKPLGPLLVAQPSILRLAVEATAGHVGVVLTSPDGAKLLSGEKALTAKDGKTQVYFRVTPQTPPAIVVLRNYDDEGNTGSITVSGAAYAPQASLSASEMNAVSKAGVN